MGWDGIQQGQGVTNLAKSGIIEGQGMPREEHGSIIAARVGAPHPGDNGLVPVLQMRVHQLL